MRRAGFNHRTGCDRRFYPVLMSGRRKQARFANVDRYRAAAGVDSAFLREHRQGNERQNSQRTHLRLEFRLGCVRRLRNRFRFRLGDCLPRVVKQKIERLLGLDV